MNTDELADHYDTLSARECLPLLLAAHVRGDAIETERLLESAPTEVWRVSHHMGLAAALCDVALIHLARLLDTTARLWRTSHLCDTNYQYCNKEPKARARDRRLTVMMVQFRNELLILAEAWKVFCGELSIDPDIPLRDLPGYDMVQLSLREARRDPDQATGDWARPIALAAAAVRADYRASLERLSGMEPESG